MALPHGVPLAVLPLSALLAVGSGRTRLTVLSIVVGSFAALVQTLGLIRWPYAVPELARRYVAAKQPEAEATRRTIEAVSRHSTDCSGSASASTSAISAS